MTVPDILIVGAGLTGATIARLLTDRGYRVLVVERRAHVGGNVRDELHPSGIRYGVYGPHYFRTNSERVWMFVQRFAEWRPWAARVQSWVDGRLEDWPVTEDYLRREGLLGPLPAREVYNFEDACLARMPREVYQRFVRGYTEKQWGVPAASLSGGLAGRFEVRAGDDRRLKTSAYQALPVGGYTAFVEKLLVGVHVAADVDYLALHVRHPTAQLTIFTGAIDEYFRFDIGRLAYRAQRRTTFWHSPGAPVQPVVQVNYPSVANPHIRDIEWKHMLPADEAAAIPGTLVTRETPYAPTDPDAYEYPFPDDANRALYRRYAERAAALDGVIFAGRLGEYRYLDMDQAIARAMALVDKTILPRLAMAA